MGCCFGCVGVFFPRVALFFIWVLTSLVSRAFNGILVPLLGFLFLPYTTLVYVLVYSPGHGGVSGFGWLLVILAFLIDLGAYGGTGVTNRRRLPRYRRG